MFKELSIEFSVYGSCDCLQNQFNCSDILCQEVKCLLSLYIFITYSVFFSTLSNWIQKRIKQVYLIHVCPQQYKVHINGKVEHSRERSCAFPYNMV